MSVVLIVIVYIFIGAFVAGFIIDDIGPEDTAPFCLFWIVTVPIALMFFVGAKIRAWLE